MTTTENRAAERAPEQPVADPIVEPVAVDQIPEPTKTAFDRITAHREGTKQPVVVPWLRDSDERTPILVWAASYTWHIALFHLARLPVYAQRVVTRAPLGLWRLVAGASNILLDAEGRPLRQSAVARDDPKEYLQLARERNARIRHRMLGAATLAFLLVAVLVLMLIFASGLAWCLAGLVTVIVLGILGHGKNRPLVSKATTPLHLAPVLRQEAVETALRSLSSIIKRDAAIEFPDPIVKDGPGYLARVNLPHGVTPAQVMAKRQELASGLRRAVGCVWPGPGPHHGGQLDLWVGDQDLATARQPAYPWLERGTGDVFGPLPYGTNRRCSKVGVTLIENNVLIGAMVGQGKTSAMRVLGLGCALDVTAELHVHELKGSGDLGALEQLAHAYGSGQDDETVRLCLEDLRWIAKEIERRAAAIKKIAKEHPDLCPNSKVTRDLANRRDLGLHPMVVLLDEVQNLYAHEQYGKDAAKLALNIIRMGRAFGVILVQATQRPDADSLPKGISANAGLRIALRIMDDYANNAILGSGMYAAGIRATDFSVKDKGIAWLVGVEEEPIVSKSYNLTTGTAEKIAHRARRMREQAGRLTGHAIGAAPEAAPKYSLLADVRTVFKSREWMHSETIVVALDDLRPDVYGGWSPETLAKNLSPHGVETTQINRTGSDGIRRNARGVTREQLDEATRRSASADTRNTAV